MSGQKSAMPATDDDTLLPFSLPSICQKKVTAAFDGGRISSDGGVLLLAGADETTWPDRHIGCDHPRPSRPRPDHTFDGGHPACPVFAIACGYPDADDLDDLRKDPAFKLACGRLPESGDDLASQPTMSRWENAPNLRTLIRLTCAMVDVWCKVTDARPRRSRSISTTPPTPCMAISSCRCSMPITMSGASCRSMSTTPTPAIAVLTILRPGKTPDGKEVSAHLRRLVRRIRLHWPNTRITIRGDGHYGRREAMDWCEQNRVHYIFGLSTQRGPGRAGLRQDR